MYELKRILESIVEYTNVVGAPANIPSIRAGAQEALNRVERLEQAEKDAPQEMRDVFAAVALIQGNRVDRRADDIPSQLRMIAEDAWNSSDAMMIERAKRIEARKAVDHAQG